MLLVSANQTLESLVMRNHVDQSERVDLAASLLDACVTSSLLSGAGAGGGSLNFGGGFSLGQNLRMRADAQVLGWLSDGRMLYDGGEG